MQAFGNGGVTAERVRVPQGEVAGAQLARHKNPKRIMLLDKVTVGEYAPVMAAWPPHLPEKQKRQPQQHQARCSGFGYAWPRHGLLYIVPARRRAATPRISCTASVVAQSRCAPTRSVFWRARPKPVRVFSSQINAPSSGK